MWPHGPLYVEGGFFICIIQELFIYVMYWRFPPRSGWFIRHLSLFSSIFGVGFITFGIRTLDSRVSLLQIGHHGSFPITLFLQRFKCWNFYKANPKSGGTSCTNFRSWFAIFLEIWSVEVRFFSGSRISSQRGDLGKIVITLSVSIILELCKKWIKLHELSQDFFANGFFF